MKKFKDSELKQMVLNHLEPHKDRIRQVFNNAKDDNELRMYVELYYNNILKDTVKELKEKTNDYERN